MGRRERATGRQEVLLPLPSGRTWPAQPFFRSKYQQSTLDKTCKKPFSTTLQICFPVINELGPINGVLER